MRNRYKSPISDAELRKAILCMERHSMREDQDYVELALDSILTFSRGENGSDYPFDDRNIKDEFSFITEKYDKWFDETSIESSVENKFYSIKNLISLAIENLVRNSRDKFRNDYHRTDKKCEISFSEFSGEIENLVYTHPEKKIEGDFIKINVMDNGITFPTWKGYKLEQFLEYGVNGNNKSVGGGGLYLVNLACKVLRSHIAIINEENNVNVAIYHPIDL